MINYFKELLATLKSIDSRLDTLQKTQERSNTHTRKLADCVNHNTARSGDRYSISTKHWNQNGY